MWFFNYFCKKFEPLTITLLDVGTVAKTDALFNFYKYLHYRQEVVAVYGFVSVIKNFKSEEREDYVNKNEKLEDLSCFSQFLVYIYKVIDWIFDIKSA